MKINQIIDLTSVKANTTESDIIKLCEDAKKHQVKSVCVNGSNVEIAKKALAGSDISITTTAGFPLGASEVFVKVCELQLAIEKGADEIDYVLSIAAVKEGDWKYIVEELSLARFASGNKILKVIIETAYLTDQEIVKCVELCDENEIDYVKTSTGFTEGATVEQIKLIKKHIKGNLKIKASGGITDKKTALALIEAGADRIGASSVEILND